MLVKPKGKRNCQTKKGKYRYERNPPQADFSATVPRRMPSVCGIAGWCCLILLVVISATSLALPGAALQAACTDSLSGDWASPETCTACASSRVNNRCPRSSLPGWSHRTSPMPDWVPEMSSPCHNCCRFIVSNLHFLYFCILCSICYSHIASTFQVVRAFGLPKLLLFYGNHRACAVSKQLGLLYSWACRQIQISSDLLQGPFLWTQWLMVGVIWVLGHRGPFSFCIVRTKDFASLKLLRVGEVKVGDIYHQIREPHWE